jgi:formylglycine-generating enzyme required for sulfatase activity/tRNA A-37 threonylcarbamoyl transferase component Bud32
MLPTGKILKGRYKITQYLSGGGFGDTYLAEDTQKPSRPICVVKHLKPKQSGTNVLKLAKELFKREAKVLEGLGQHDQIPTLFAYFDEGNEFYLVQEFINGDNLEDKIQLGQPWNESQVINLLAGILEVLVFVHQKKVIHRDIKPPNLIRRKPDGKIVLIDFGAVKEVNTVLINPQGHTTFSTVIGSAGYTPSEQSKGKPKLASDVYAVGKVAIQALTGVHPTMLPEDPNTGEVIWRNRANITNPDLANILDKMVRDYFPNRYQNAQEVLLAMQQANLITSVPPTQPVNSPQTQQQLVPPMQPINNPVGANTNPHTVRVAGVSPIPTTQPSPDPNTGRRDFLQVLGYVGLGITGVMLWERFTEGRQNTDQPIVSNTPESPVQQPEPEPPPAIRQSEPISQASPEPEPVPEPEPIPEPPAKTSNIITETFPVITVNRRGEEIDRRQGSAQVFQENLGNGVILEMVKIPAGSFIMGSPPDEEGRSDAEGPQHQVNIKEFWMGKYAVTQAQYQQIMGNNPANFIGEKRPVEQVSWDMAQEFCQKLSTLTGKKYQLPSEAQWEYAGRAGTTTPFHFGGTLTDQLANYNANYTYADAPKGVYRQQTTDVGSFPPNAFGLYDIHGNVWEWVEDSWHDNYQGAPNDGSAWISNDENYSERGLRGGSWSNLPVNCRVAVRSNLNRSVIVYYIGFRVSCAVV